MGQRIGNNAWTVGQYFVENGGMGDAAVTLDAPEDMSWKKPWFTGFFVGTVVGISIGFLLKK